MGRATVTRPLLAVLTAVVLAVSSGCAGEGSSSTRSPSPTASSTPDAAACAGVSSRLVKAVQRYVDAYGMPVSTRRAKAPATTAPDDQALQSALRGAGQALQSQGCDLQEFRTGFERELAQVRADGPVARAVLLRLTAQLTGTAKPAKETVRLRPGADLPARIAELPGGSVVRLAAGRYRLDAPLALLEGITVRGAGAGRTIVESTAGEAGILVLTDARVELRALTVRHRGKRPSDLVVGGPTSALVVTDVRLEGARATAKGVGGNAVLMTARTGATPDRGTTLQVTGASFAGNASAGVMLAGGHRASIRRSRFSGNGECGVCFLDASSGAVRSSRFVGNKVGVAVLDRAKPLLLGDTFAGGAVGVQVSGRARAVVRRADVSGATRAAIIFSDRTRGRVDRSTCADVPFGVVVAPDALPFVGDNDCAVARGG